MADKKGGFARNFGQHFRQYLDERVIQMVFQGATRIFERKASPDFSKRSLGATPFDSFQSGSVGRLFEVKIRRNLRGF
jgi:hypothetical protein